MGVCATLRGLAEADLAVGWERLVGGRVSACAGLGLVWYGTQVRVPAQRFFSEHSFREAKTSRSPVMARFRHDQEDCYVGIHPRLARFADNLLNEGGTICVFNAKLLIYKN